MITKEMNDISTEVVRLLKEKGLKISFAESCTGGMVSAALTSVSGASDVFDLSFVTYANRTKNMFLGVDREVLDDPSKGAVSRDCAIMMAKGIREHSSSDIGVGITGIAGPDGGTPEKPVGTVYVVVNFCADNGVTVARKGCECYNRKDCDYGYEKGCRNGVINEIVGSFNLSGNRDEVRTQTVIGTLELVREALI